MIFYEGQLSRSHLELSFAKITVFPDERTDERTDIGSEKLADVIGASRNNTIMNNPFEDNPKSPTPSTFRPILARNKGGWRHEIFEDIFIINDFNVFGPRRRRKFL